jgi:arylsulfatase A
LADTTTKGCSRAVLPATYCERTDDRSSHAAQGRLFHRLYRKMASWVELAQAGRWHFAQAISDGPTTRGFDYYFGTDVPNYPPYCFIENDRTVGFPSAKAPLGTDSFNIAGPMLPNWKLVDVLPELEKQAVEYIGKAAKIDKPFFLYLPLTSPHYPVVPSADFKGKGKVGDYGDFVTQTDAVLGKVLDALKAAGVAEKTLVVFTSDNGPEITGEVNPGAYDRLQKYGHASMGTLRGAKRDAWEGGHRVPFVARWPGIIAAGVSCDETVCHVDLMATLAALLQVKLPSDAGVDSVNILPALRGENRSQPLREATVHHSAQGKFAIRKDDWVLILAPTGDDNAKKGEPEWFRKDRAYITHIEAGELYNLAKDPTQKDNLYAAEAAKVRELAELMEKYVIDGRSTPGARQKNDVNINWDKRKLPVAPPKGAIVLLDEKGNHLFLSMAGEKIDWPLDNGVLVPKPKGNRNHIVSKLHFRDAVIHVEFMLPENGPGNSGVYIHGHYEVQILNSFGKEKVTQEDSGALYGFAPPLVNACRQPGEWQVLDIRYRAPRRDESGKIVENGTVSVWFNGKQVQDGTQFGEPKSPFHPFRFGTTPYLELIRDRQKKTMTGPVFLQDHGNLVKFRNVWVLPADDRAFVYDPENK